MSSSKSRTHRAGRRRTYAACSGHEARRAFDRCSAQSQSSCSAGRRDSPSAVSAYVEVMGGPISTVRATSPASSSSRRRSVSTGLETPTTRRATRCSGQGRRAGRPAAAGSSAWPADSNSCATDAHWSASLGLLALRLKVAILPWFKYSSQLRSRILVAQGNLSTVPAGGDHEGDRDPIGDVEPAGGADDDGARACALARLRDAQGSGHPISALVGPAAAALGVTPRTIWRWLDEGLPGSRPSGGWAPSEDDVDAYLRWKGNAAAAWRERMAAGTVPSLRTFQTVLARHFEPGDRAVMREGVEARRRHQVYLRWEPEARNEAVGDRPQGARRARLFPRAQRPHKPWTTLFVDGFSRAVMGWAISEYPSSASVLAALGEAVRIDDRRGPFGGIPVGSAPTAAWSSPLRRWSRPAGCWPSTSTRRRPTARH